MIKLAIVLVICVISVECENSTVYSYESPFVNEMPPPTYSPTNQTYYLYAFNSIYNNVVLDVEECTATPFYHLFLGDKINVNVKNSTSNWVGFLEYELVEFNSTKDKAQVNVTKNQKESFDQVSFYLIELDENNATAILCSFKVLMVKPAEPTAIAKYSEKSYFQFDCKEYLSEKNDKYVHVGWLDSTSRLITTYNSTELDVNITISLNGTELFCLLVDLSMDKPNSAMEKLTLIIYDVDPDGGLSTFLTVTIVVVGLLTAGIILLLNTLIYRQCQAKNKQSPGFGHDNFQDRFYLNMLFREQCDREIRELEAHQYEEISDHDYEEIDEHHYEEIDDNEEGPMNNIKGETKEFTDDKTSSVTLSCSIKTQ